MEKIFELLGINRKLVQNAVEALGNDSQKGTLWSQENMKAIPTSPLTLQKRKRYNALCSLIGIPDLFDC